MGTSKSFPTPAGGNWTPLKNDVTDRLGGDTQITAQQIVAGTIAAAGSILGAIRSVGGPGDGASSGTLKTTGRSGRAATSKAVSGLSGFAAAVQRGGLTEGLRALGLEKLKDHSAAEIIAAIADHLSESAEGLGAELLKDALTNSILEAAALAGDPTFENLERALQDFLASDGIEGLVEIFLSNLAFDQVWTLIENHVELRSDTARQTQSLAEAIQHCCRTEAHTVIESTKQNLTFARVDWFGSDGKRQAENIAIRLESRLIESGS